VTARHLLVKLRGLERVVGTRLNLKDGVLFRAA